MIVRRVEVKNKRGKRIAYDGIYLLGILPLYVKVVTLNG